MRKNVPKKEKRYASWSGHGFGCGDFSVMLYSNQVGDGTVVLNIFFDELMNFAEKRYKHLQTIMQEIDRKKEEYMTDWRKKVIDRSDNPIDQIDILIAENNLRFSNDYYSNELHVLHKIFGFKVRENQNTRLTIKSQSQFWEDAENVSTTKTA